MKPFNILGRKVPVKVASLDFPYNNALAVYDFETKTITINADLKDSTPDVTLLHEVGHAIFDRSGLRQSISREVEEILVDLFATVISENYILKKR